MPNDLRHWILGENDQPVQVDLITWALWFEDANRRIRRTLIETDNQKADCSTVFLGVDHSMPGLGGPPLLFETMVFCVGHADDEECQRYSTIEQARVGHESTVNEWIRKLGANAKIASDVSRPCRSAAAPPAGGA